MIVQCKASCLSSIPYEWSNFKPGKYLDKAKQQQK